MVNTRSRYKLDHSKSALTDIYVDALGSPSKPVKIHPAVSCYN